MANRPKLTVKEAKLVKAKAEGKTTLQAANEAEYLPGATDESRRVEAQKTLQKPHVQEALHIALEKAGITPELAVAPIGEALLHDDLDMRLKGSDRALKLMVPKGEGTSVNINFNQVAKEDRDVYDL